MAAGQWPAAEVDPQFVDPLVGLLLRHDRHRNVDSSGRCVEVEDDLLEAVSLPEAVVDVLDQDVALVEPGVHLGGVRHKRLYAPDPPAYGMVQYRFAGE